MRGNLENCGEDTSDANSRMSKAGMGGSTRRESYSTQDGETEENTPLESQQRKKAEFIQATIHQDWGHSQSTDTGLMNKIDDLQSSQTSFLNKILSMQQQMSQEFHTRLDELQTQLGTMQKENIDLRHEIITMKENGTNQSKELSELKLMLKKLTLPPIEQRVQTPAEETPDTKDVMSTEESISKPGFLSENDDITLVNKVEERTNTTFKTEAEGAEDESSSHKDIPSDDTNPNEDNSSAEDDGEDGGSFQSEMSSSMDDSDDEELPAFKLAAEVETWATKMNLDDWVIRVKALNQVVIQLTEVEPELHSGLAAIIKHYEEESPELVIDIQKLETQKEEELTRVAVNGQVAVSNIWVTAKMRQHQTGAYEAETTKTEVEGFLTVAHAIKPTLTDGRVSGTRNFQTGIQFPDLASKDGMTTIDCDCSLIYCRDKRDDLLLAIVNPGKTDLKEKFLIDRSVNMLSASTFYPFDKKHEKLMSSYKARIILGDMIIDEAQFEVFKSKGCEWRIDVRINSTVGYSRKFKAGDSGGAVIATRIGKLKGPEPNKSKRRPRPPIQNQGITSDTEIKSSINVFQSTPVKDHYRPKEEKKMNTDYLVGMVITDNAMDSMRAGLCVIQPTLDELQRTQNVYSDISLYGIGHSQSKMIQVPDQNDSGLGQSVMDRSMTP